MSAPALDGLVTYRLWRELGFPPENTLHDVRWGRQLQGRRRERLRVGPGDLRRRARPHTSWMASRAASANASPPCTSGSAVRRSRASANPVISSGAACTSRTTGCSATSDSARLFRCPHEETQDRWNQTTPQWPIMHAVLKGVSARPDDGQAQGQPHSGGLRARCVRRDAKQCSPRRRPCVSWALKVHFCGVGK